MNQYYINFVIINSDKNLLIFISINYKNATMFWFTIHKNYFCQTPLILLLLLSLSLFYHQTVPVECATTQPAYNLSADPPVDSIPVVCQPPDTPHCNIDSYLTLKPFRNSFGHENLQVALAELHKHAYLMYNQPCKSKVQLFLCSLYTPVCARVPTTDGEVEVLDQLLLPCREQCEKARELCRSEMRAFNSTWPEEWECTKFKSMNEDKMCVKDNDNATRNVEETICSHDLIDCGVDNPSLERKAYCIEKAFFCDGKKDCPNGRDEEGCPKKCAEGLFDCGSECLDKSDICSRKIKCAGTEELDCNNFLTFLNHPIVGVFLLASFIYACIRIFKSDNEDSELDETPKEIYSEPEEELPDPDLHEHQSICSNFYERINPGGHSGASSIIYATYGMNSSIDSDILDKPAPPAPPPTPAPPTPGLQPYIYNEY